jgi:hypothetical protein
VLAHTHEVVGGCLVFGVWCSIVFVVLILGGKGLGYARHATQRRAATHTPPNQNQIQKPKKTTKNRPRTHAPIVPEAATAGMPMPGKTESPQSHSPSTGRLLGYWSTPARIDGPYVPRSRRRKRACVSGVPARPTFTRLFTSGMIFARARHSTSLRSALSFSYSGLPCFRPSYSE